MMNSKTRKITVTALFSFQTKRKTIFIIKLKQRKAVIAFVSSIIEVGRRKSFFFLFCGNFVDFYIKVRVILIESYDKVRVIGQIFLWLVNTHQVIWYITTRCTCLFFISNPKSDRISSTCETTLRALVCDSVRVWLPFSISFIL